MPNPLPVSSRSTGQNYSKSEQRRSHRHACKIAAGWRLLGAPDLRFMPATVQDISRNGFALRVKTECKKGAILSIRLESETEKFAGPWLGQVVNIRQPETGTWVIGCAFCSEFTEGDLDAMLRSCGQPAPVRTDAAPPPAFAPAAMRSADPPPSSSSQKERRSAPRRNSKRVAIIVALTNGKRYFGRVINGSASGLGLALPRSLAPGAVVKVRATNVGLAVPWASVQIRHCRRSNHESIVGCQFTDEASASLLETFCPLPA